MYKHNVDIKEYNGYLIITINDFGPKLKIVGTGILFNNFNEKDLLISKNAFDILTQYAGKVFKDPVLEIITPTTIWWANTKGLIIPPNEQITILHLPLFTLIDNNDIEEKLKAHCK